MPLNTNIKQNIPLPQTHIALQQPYQYLLLLQMHHHNCIWYTENIKNISRFESFCNDAQIREHILLQERL